MDNEQLWKVNNRLLAQRDKRIAILTVEVERLRAVVDPARELVERTSWVHGNMVDPLYPVAQRLRKALKDVDAEEAKKRG